MSFTKLQRVALEHAETIVCELDSRVHTLAHKHNFTTDRRNTPENDLLQDIRVLRDIIQALKEEK